MINESVAVALEFFKALASLQITLNCLDLVCTLYSLNKAE